MEGTRLQEVGDSQTLQRLNSTQRASRIDFVPRPMTCKSESRQQTKARLQRHLRTKKRGTDNTYIEILRATPCSCLS